MGRLDLRVVTHNWTHTPGRTPLHERSARRKGRCLHDTQETLTSMPAAGFEPAIPAIKRRQTYTLDCTATGTGCKCNYFRWLNRVGRICAPESFIQQMGSLLFRSITLGVLR